MMLNDMVKRYFILLVALLLYVVTQAQERVWNSAFLKNESPHTLYSFQAGMSWMKFDDTFGVKGKQGYNATFRFMDPLRKVPGNFYWGMEFGFASRGFEKERKGHKEHVMAHSVIISPVQFGHLFKISNVLKVDMRLGLYASGDMAGEYRHNSLECTLSRKSKKKDQYGDREKLLPDDWKWNYFDIGGSAGLGIVFCMFNLDFSYRYGLLEAAKNTDWHTRVTTFQVGVVF